ncbi:hypothetical protein B0T24DRAFT_602318 [Lasiosphaeria ovina]|uniref:HNH nuclease domain-containing protein n=1 Tax=Lasiosphaeria ovina TaxID=92902 RepID=A0AAE0NJT4_9PEZI|nr:hypothetical protein B0T24DRAFT_602318 [Lasiosphaeria ovina]
MLFFWDEDPLSSLPEITPHPGRSGSQSSEALSSAPPAPIIEQNEIVVVNNVLREYRPIHTSDDTSRVLQAFVDNLSGPGLSTLLTEIYNFANDPRQLRQLRNFLVDAILKSIVAAAGGKQPPITPSPNKTAAFAIELSRTIIEGSTRSGQASLKEKCLRRDRSRCVASGIIDSDVYRKLPPGERRGAKHSKTKCAHILPFALSKLKEKNATHTKNKATTWWALYQYFLALKNKVGADTVNQPENTMTLSAAFHDEFGLFSYGFQATDEPHKISYRDPGREFLLRGTTTTCCYFCPARCCRPTTRPRFSRYPPTDWAYFKHKWHWYSHSAEPLAL